MFSLWQILCPEVTPILQEWLNRKTTDEQIQCPITGKPVFKQYDDLMVLLAAEIGAERLVSLVRMLEGGDAPDAGKITPIY